MAYKIKDIKESLIMELEKKGADVSCFISLIDDYIYYWKKERELQSDVNKNGLKYERMSANGKMIEVENPAVKSSVMYNKQKLAILKDLGITTSDCRVPEDDEL